MTTALIKKARQFAFQQHKGQIRKGKLEPFSKHLEAVAEIVSQLTDDEELIAGAYLHDVVEDTPVTLEEIDVLFGKQVAKLVALESEAKESDVLPSKTWHKRKENQLQTLRGLKGSEQEVYYIALGDKLANSREMLRDYEEVGDKLWERFNNPNPQDHYWYYQSFADIIGAHPLLAKSAPYKELLATLTQLFPSK
ncbi:HD domain-containing protein [Vagococcus intermedius]|uniref:HD domain-containing protein n=1 Tax=Vagococcus intermedius TaxID=2991418 RepID=A0AAF0CU75_9ENTE|nr:HD domain-containing protein [Vagococcus intermedius]WEG73068.1 HD domain-containing protein [Vagococcus intermedius]WEG75152.1 HD domain-containing protein [Vagococcus intermedius]